MEKIQITLSVFYDGQFFTALFERNGEKGYSAVRRVFPALPSDIELYQFILDDYRSLSFSKPVRNGEKSLTDKSRNPKRIQRKAVKSLSNVGFSTKAQEAIKLQHEKKKEIKILRRSEDKEKEADLQYELRVRKRKEKHRGR